MYTTPLREIGSFAVSASAFAPSVSTQAANSILMVVVRIFTLLIEHAWLHGRPSIAARGCVRRRRAFALAML
ncbi:hypothetical protein BvRS1_11950 [Burkholderia vietnamiensis]|nr:hypothetical protein BvRS1_11950 [Burkholderia vietnamiensis]